MTSTAAPTRPRRQAIRWLVVGCALSVAGGLGVVRLFPSDRGPHWLRVPTPNGYDELIDAGAELQKGKHVAKDFEVIETGDVRKLQALVGPYSEVLDRARKALRQASAVPPAAGTGSQINVVIARTKAIRTVSHFLLAQGKLAQVQGRTADAFRLDLDLVRLGHAARHGGLLLDAMTGYAISAMGGKALQGLRPSLSAEECREAASVLLSLDAAREPIDSVLDRERAFGLAELRAQGGRFAAFAFQFTGQGERLLKSAFDAARESSLRSMAAQRLLATELAIQAYQLQNGALPDRLENLVPRELTAVPKDPYGSSPLVYRKEASGYRLYSVGPDRHDDGGLPVNPAVKSAMPKGDLVPGSF